MYTIGQVSKMTGLPVSTLRYYDKEGLFPDLQRSGGIRRFTDRELDAVRVIECLKQSGLEIRDIRRFMDWCAQGSATYPQRRALFVKQRAAVEAELRRMNRVLDLLKYKCWYYDEAIRDGGEQRLQAMKPEDLPPEIRQAYENSHG